MRHSVLKSVLLVMALVALPSFAHGQKKSRGDRNKITRDELVEAATTANSAYDLIHIMRPLWLEPAQGRMASASGAAGGDVGTTGMAQEVVVYVNGTRQPSLEQLKTLRLPGIQEMRYLDQNRAIQMHGPGHEKGVIEVTLVDASKP
jgi:hypothetical protein